MVRLPDVSRTRQRFFLVPTLASIWDWDELVSFCGSSACTLGSTAALSGLLPFTITSLQESRVRKRFSNATQREGVVAVWRKLRHSMQRRRSSQRSVWEENPSCMVRWGWRANLISTPQPAGFLRSAWRLSHDSRPAFASASASSAASSSHRRSTVHHHTLDHSWQPEQQQ